MKKKKENFLMIPNEQKEGWHYLVVKKLSTLLIITSKHHVDFYCLHSLSSFRIENKLHKSHKKVCGYKDIFGIAMLSE